MTRKLVIHLLTITACFLLFSISMLYSERYLFLIPLGMLGLFGQCYFTYRFTQILLTEPK
ncbi:hypothetical protein LZP85_11455 [Priestia flexa]|uniref:Uncharacterized protein n=1 Tax=Priestia flexa TaxID=86664 RepID=A0A1N6QU23_9BACI|nr:MULTISPECIES: hypothetical protein [Bacillaceae]KZB91765.1 hypothetical protein A2U94_08640 [Bacillus sp. VT 712]MBN8251927.1 hypothetical protein [Priestia flexa]MBN8435429.1 hypothetical protein [Priestia flexa]MBY6085469.1 hypothetical protein [Priestia flexa]MCA0967995.1 hypothetical protein [Priestia flexa]